MMLSTQDFTRMVPLDVLWSELKDIVPSLRIEYDANTGKTCVLNRDIPICNAESLSRAIILAWLHYFKKGNTNDDRTII